MSRRLSFTATKIFPARRQFDGSLRDGPVATGFLWLHDGILHLVTNWHNVTGWDPVNDRPISRDRLTPNVISVNVAHRGGLAGYDTMRWGTIVVDLFDADDCPAWLEHPTHGRQVDVVVLPIAQPDLAVWNEPINTFPEFVAFSPAAGDDAFVLGYPKGLDGGAMLPIWKRASIASEPGVDLDRLPKLLVDTATRPGMSGSPVIAARTGTIHPDGHEGPELSDDTIIGTVQSFLGVYSGRVDDDPLGAQLGIVWKARVVDEILDGAVRGRTPFD